MIVQTATTSMRDWASSRWTITSDHILGTVAPLPPQPMAIKNILQDRGLLENAPPGGFRVLSPDENEEFMEDLALAQQALDEYEAKGVEVTVAYSEYRTKRLGSMR